MQVPTAVSAIKVDGKRAYQRVRDGEEVELKARPVTVHELVVGEVRAVGEHLDVDVSLRCSSGTYVRAIARDVGAALGVGGHLTALRRTAVGPYDLAVAQTLEQLAEEFIGAADRARPPGGVRVLELDESAAADVRVGRRLEVGLDAAERGLPPTGSSSALYGLREGRARAAVFVERARQDHAVKHLSR